MPGSLIKISEATGTGSAAELKVTGIDSTYEVYYATMLILPSTDDKDVNLRVTKSGTAQTDSKYNAADVGLREGASFNDYDNQDQATMYLFSALGTTGAEMMMAQVYLFNFADSSEYSYITYRSCALNRTPELIGYTGSLFHEVASASDGISLALESADNFSTSSKIVLYGLAK